MTVRIRPGMWFVTGSHRVTTDDWPHPQWRPPGLHHARRAGEGRTRCGLTAVEWPIFWEMEFSPQDALACQDCVMGTRRSESSEREAVGCG
jgi:hypothetical protein